MLLLLLSSILSGIHAVTIGTMLNNNDGNKGHELKYVNRPLDISTAEFYGF